MSDERRQTSRIRIVYQMENCARRVNYSQNSWSVLGYIFGQNFFRTHFFTRRLPKKSHCDLFSSLNIILKLSLSKQHFLKWQAKSDRWLLLKSEWVYPKVTVFLPEHIFPLIEFSDSNNTLTTQGKGLPFSSLPL